MPSHPTRQPHPRTTHYAVSPHTAATSITHPHHTGTNPKNNEMLLFPAEALPSCSCTASMVYTAAQGTPMQGDCSIQVEPTLPRDKTTPRVSHATHTPLQQQHKQHSHQVRQLQTTPVSPQRMTCCTQNTTNRDNVSTTRESAQSGATPCPGWNGRRQHGS